MEVLDFFASSYPLSNRLLAKAYGFAINRLPSVWKKLYQLGDAGPSGCGVGLNALMRRRFERILREKAPDVVISTFPGYSILVPPDPEKRTFQFHTVITDAISVNALWCEGNSDLVFVTDRFTKSVVADLGVKEERIHALGFPIRYTPPVDLELPSESPAKILYLPTTKTSHVAKTLDRLTSWIQRYEAELTVVLGNHASRLSGPMDKAKSQLSGDQLTVLGWEDNVPALMARHHTVITKAGGASVSEALGAHCPPIINYVVPGQEEGNAELVLKSQCGLQISDSAELDGALSKLLLEDDARLWCDFRTSLKEMDRGHASREIAETI